MRSARFLVERVRYSHAAGTRTPAGPSRHRCPAIAYSLRNERIALARPCRTARSLIDRALDDPSVARLERARLYRPVSKSGSPTTWLRPRARRRTSSRRSRAFTSPPLNGRCSPRSRHCGARRRLDSGLLQREVAERIGADESTVTNWELSRTKPALWFLPAIVRFLGYTPWTADGSIGERLLAYRRERGLSQSALARLLGVDSGTLSRWERGFRLPTGKYVRLAEAFLGV